VLVPNIIAFKQGQQVQYLRDPKLYHFLADDSAWQSQYKMESWTDADKMVIHDAMASGWGMPGLNLFSAIPGISNRSLPIGGLPVALVAHNCPLPQQMKKELPEASSSTIVPVPRF
jgi:hypothetical protein